MKKMNTIHTLCNEAERLWREEVKHDFPLHSSTPVIRRQPKDGRNWSFSTDLVKIYAEIAHDDSKLQQLFETTIAHLWDQDPEIVARDTLHYLFFHELYHPLEAPFSTKDSTGHINDNKCIHQAIRRGILQAEPDLSPLEQVAKVHAAQNGVKDFILDNRFYLDNLDKEYVQEDIVPVWDVLELQELDTKTNFYTITRYMYGVLYGPQSTHSFFEEKCGAAGAKIAEKALTALLSQSVTLPQKKGLVERAKSFFSSTDVSQEQLLNYAHSIREQFAPRDSTRYQAIERLMAVLGPYVEKNMPQTRPGVHGEGSGASPQNILQDLLDDMSSEEQAAFINELGEEENPEIHFSSGIADSVSGDTRSTDELNSLDVLSLHEFYKRNHPKVTIVSGKKVGETVVVGKREKWNLTRSQVLTRDQLSRVNMQQIARLQQRTRLPWLIDLGNGTFRLNEYDIKQTDLKDIVYRESNMDVPDVIEFYLDSSGSMYKYGSELGFNDNSQWDMLCNVLYGYVDATRQAGQILGKQPQLRIHNVGNFQKDSSLIYIDEFWKGNPSTLKTLFKPANGYQQEDLNITHYDDNRERVYVVVTDGSLVISGRTERESQKMKALAKDKKNSVVLFEIGGSYGLGNAVRSDPNIVYHSVYNKKKMLSAGLEVILSK